MMDVNLDAWLLLERALTHARDVPVVTYRRDGVLRRYTYLDMARRALQLMQALDRLGVARRAVVGTVAWNSDRHLEAYFGVPCSDRVIHTINPRLPADDLAYVIQQAGDEVLIVEPDFLHLLDRIPDALGAVKHVVVLGDEAPPVGRVPSVMTYEELILAEEPEWRRRTIDERSAMSICYTSGSTGRPKGVVYTHRSTVLQAFAVASGAGASIGPSDAVCCQIPMYHSTFMPHAALLVGAKQVLYSGLFDPASFLRILAEEQVTISAGIPTIWIDIADAMAAGHGRLPHLRHVLTGGIAPSSALIARYRDLGVELVQGWGMTEISSMSGVSWPKAHMREWEPGRVAAVVGGATGLPMPGISVTIRDDGGNDVAWDGETIGDIWVRGIGVADRYLGGERAEDFRDGWFRTGDVGVISAEGYLTLKDRARDLIKSGGEWISSTEMENVLAGLDAVVEVGVVAAQDERWGERPVPVVVLRPHHVLDIGQVREVLAAAGFARWQLPVSIRVIESMPRSGVGKIDKVALRRGVAGSD